MGEKITKTRKNKNTADAASGASVRDTAGASVNDREVDVLYQKLGDRWFAFSLIDDEIFIGSIAPDELKDAGK